MIYDNQIYKLHKIQILQKYFIKRALYENNGGELWDLFKRLEVHYLEILQING